MKELAAFEQRPAESSKSSALTPDPPPSPEPKTLPEKLAQLWRDNKGASLVGGLFTGAMFFYVLPSQIYQFGERNCDRGCTAKVDALTASHERALAKKEEEVRELTRLNATLQAALQLGDSDRKRLLEITAVAPQVRVTVNGVPVRGDVMLPCSDTLWLAFEIENTGLRDLRPAGFEVLIDPSALEGAAVETGVGAEKVRPLWRHRGDFLLAPGAKFQFPQLGLYRNSAIARPDGGSPTVFVKGERLQFDAKLFSSDHLPWQASFYVVCTQP